MKDTIKGDCTFIAIIEGEFAGQFGFTPTIAPKVSALVEVFTAPYHPTENWQQIPVEYLREVTEAEHQEILKVKILRGM